MRAAISHGMFATLALVAACGADEVVAASGAEGQPIEVSVGQELRITLGTVGPGRYASPPTLSSSALRFLDVADVGPNVPSGVTQQFRFKAVGKGRTIVVFQHTGGIERPERAVVDTVDVR